MSQETKNVPQKVLEFITTADTAMTKAASELAVVHEQKQACVAIVPDVIAALVANGRIKEDQREKVASFLADPVSVLTLMIKVAAHRNVQEATHLGEGVDDTVKSASVNSLNNPYVGGRTTQIRESDRRLFQGVGLAAPTS